MQTELIKSYAFLGRTLRGRVAPVGEAWRTARSDLLGVSFYELDGSHPTPAGSYLAAATITATILERLLESAPAAGVSDSVATALVEIVNG